MKGIAFSPAISHGFFNISHNAPRRWSISTKPIQFVKNQNQNQNPSTKTHSFPSFVLKSSKHPPTPVNPEANAPPLVVGSANADIYVEIERLPREGETVSAKSGQTLAGGKGANQAACGSKLSYPTYFVGQVGEDAHGKLIIEALRNGGVHLDYVRHVGDVPTGHAVVMLQSDGQNSIIIVGGANMSCWPENLSDEDLAVMRNAGILLLQREIPDSVNIQVAKAAKRWCSCHFRCWGMDAPIPLELLNVVDIFSPNESELGRITGMPTENFEQIGQAVTKCHEMGVREVLVKLGVKGSALFVEGQKPIRQPIIRAARVIDTRCWRYFYCCFCRGFGGGQDKRGVHEICWYGWCS
ncbi:hypothetical protein GH714_026823 [Hevea brasiliensis]|uniref:Ribokinase n=1 Tax=Hevea brasiliensis TaxID=3981 RepID=A0A6A6MNA9_HEVBR|nr:hypothetical protein GH714_026823 [Hevea brasiliensis]